MKFAFIDRHRDRWPIVVMCRVLGVSRSGFFAWCKRPPSTASQRRAELTEQVRQVHEVHRKVYGSPRVHRALRHAGVAVCVNTVAKLMHLAGIQAQTKRSFVPRTTDSSATTLPAPNTLSRNFAIGAINRRWVSDITYVPTGEGWLYLAAIVDLGSRRVVGWAMDVTMAATLVCEALRMALQQRDPLPGAGMLHHSDRGSQYASDDYQQLLQQHDANVSMSRPANCYDNAAMESFFATLKTELIHHEDYTTHQQARASIFEYIEVFYNRKRLHSTLGYVSPERFEASLT